MRLKPILEEKARERLKTSTGGNEPRPMTNWSEAENGTTRKQLAEISGTSEGTIARVETIVTKGTPELKVKYGDVLQRAKENQGTRTDLKPFGDFSKKSESINTREEISKETGVPEWQTRQLFEIIK